MENIEEVKMGESCIFSLDLVSENRCQDHMVDGIIRKIREIPFEYPRPADLRIEPEFARVCGEVTRMLRVGK